MRLHVLLKFAKILMISRMRSTRRSFITNSITNRPLLIALIGAALFVGGLGAGEATVSFFSAASAGPAAIDQIVLTIYGGIPIFVIGFFFTMGLLWELNASSESESTDAVNWLPISPSEYVFASSLSTSYTYSPLVAAAIGWALPIGVLTGNGLAFLLLVAISLVSTFIGSVGVEILRSLLARASSAFSKMGARTMVVSRILGVVLILLFTQALFSGFLIVRVISTLVGNVAATIAVPIFWPTLSITSLLTSNPLASAFFSLLSLGFFLALAFIALSLRARFWVMAPPSLRFSGSSSVTGVSRFRKLGLSTTSIALVRREIRSATRRKEVVRLMAIPIILPVMITFPVIFSPAPTSGSAPPSQISPILLAGPLLFGVGLGALFLGMTSIGQEGKRLWNIGALPISAGMIVKSKIMFTSLIGMIGLVLSLGLTMVLFHLSMLDFFTFTGVGLTVILAEASLGIAVGSHYPDFSDGPRPRFVTIAGSILGSVLGIIMMVLISGPFIVFIVARLLFGIPFSLYLSLLFSGLVGLLFSWIGYVASIKPVEGILREVPN